MDKKHLLLHGFSFILFFLASIYITYPLIFHMGQLVTGYGDEFLIAWIQNWVIHAISTNIFSLFDANIFYPYSNTLAYSDLFLTSSIFSIIPLYLLGQPIAAFNFTLISSLVLLGFSVYLLSFSLTRDFLASFLAGILVIFCPVVVDKKTHIQILAIQWVPLAILFFLVFISSGKSKYLFISLVFFLLQTYNSLLPGYFIVFSYLIIFFCHWISEKKKTKKLITKKNIIFCLFSLVLIIPLMIPYYQVSREFHYTRDIRDTIHLALQPEDLFYTSRFSRLEPYLIALPFNKVSQNNEFQAGFLGFVFTILAIIAFYQVIKNFKKNDYITNSFIAIASLGLILSFGPFLHLARHTIHHPFPIPLPYALFYYIVPGFQGFRNSSRWEMLFIVCIAIVISLTLHKMLKKYSLTKKGIIYGCLLIGCIVEFNFPIQFYPVPQKSQFPKIYYWLNTTPQDSAVIFMPAYNWNMTYIGDEMQREYFSTVSFRKMVNGYSGFSPMPWQELVNFLKKEFPENKSIEQLRKIGIDYIIVDKEAYDKNVKKKELKINGEEVINALKKNSSVTFIKQIDNYYIFHL